MYLKNNVDHVNAKLFENESKRKLDFSKSLALDLENDMRDSLKIFK